MRDFVQEMFDTGPQANPLMERINQESQGLLAAVEALQGDIVQKQAALEDLRGRLQSQMDILTATLGDQQQLVEREIASCDQKTQELKDGIGQIKDGIVAALDAAQQQLNEYQSHVEQGRQMVENANQAAQQLITTVHGGIQQGREALHQATDFANQRIDDLQGTIDDTLQQTEALASQLIDHVDTGIRETGSKVQEMVGTSFSDLQSMFGSAMELLQGNVIQNGVNMILDDLQSRIQTELNQLIDQIVAELVQHLASTREGLFSNAQSAGLERKALEPILNQLDDILKPLFSAVDHLKGMASMVGIDL
jgi:molybdopterin converting factor small subunit